MLKTGKKLCTKLSRNRSLYTYRKCCYFVKETLNKGEKEALCVKLKFCVEREARKRGN